MDPLSLFVVSMTITPGPNNLMLMTSGVHHGIRRSLPHYFGICGGFPLLVLSVGWGMGQILQDWPLVFESIRLLGMAYLGWLALGLARLAWQAPQALESDADTGMRPFTFGQAVLFQWVNPKAWTMAVGGLAAFTTLDTDYTRQVVEVALHYVILGSPCVAFWLLGGAIIRRWLMRPRWHRLFNLSMALLLLASIGPMLQTTITRV